MEYLGKLHETVVKFPQTDIWMDSCGAEELDFGMQRGISGATSCNLTEYLTKRIF